MVGDEDGGPDGGDPTPVPFDDAFVAAASLHEPSARERIRSRRSSPAAPRRRPRRRRRRGRRPRPLVVLALVALGVAVWVGRAQLRDAAGSAGYGHDHGDEVVPEVVAPGEDRPTPAADPSPVPLGAPPEVPEDDRWAPLATQPGSDEVVAHDPCRPLRVVVNDRAMPPGGDRLVREAIDAVADATGLRIELEGPTDERPDVERPLVQRDRYGDRWAPLLVAWTDPEEVAELEDAAGIGGGTAVVAEGGRHVYVSGLVYLDGPDLGDLLGRDRGWEQARAVVLHELGHAVGLAHVEDPDQLMHGEASSEVTSFGAGDRTGLAALGQGPCAPDL